LNDRENDRLAHHVSVDLSEARVDRVWGRVSARLGGPRRARGWVWTGVGACAVAAALVVFVRARGVDPGMHGTVASAWEGAQLETAADALSVTLTDGSSLKVEPRSRVEVGDRTASALKLVLARGRIACDVTHRPGRSFVVAAGGVEVRVVGTRFSVANDEADGGARVEVRVERGTVEVRSPGGEIVRVEAGHTWSQVTKTEALAAEVEAPTPPVPSPEKSHAAPRARPDARELFEQARSQWRAGRIEAAAQTYQALLASHPRDPRAGLAAFELGRLRMDRLGDMPGAVTALQQAVALAPGAELREDALARLVAASAAAHDRTRCARARARYLTEYPTGVHHRTVDATACE
jgi:ferric-dicitrate binding protein FerR (iron transport regulator)